MNKKLLEHFGWTIECESPLEISHEDGSFASGQAADMVAHCVENEWYDDEEYEE